jgi:carboxymethylenebutenolidase
MDQRIIDLYDEYTHAPLERREFLNRLARLAGGTAAAYALLPLLENRSAMAASRTSGIAGEYIAYPAESGPVRAYLARPSSEGPHPALLVIHENRGLNAHIEDVTRRAAADGFLAMAPDALSPLGGTPEDEDEARTRIGQLDSRQNLANFVAGASYLASHDESTGRVGCVGFCWGGAMAGQLAIHAPDLSAAVAFYGRQPDVEDVPRVRVPLLLHYAALDERINAGIPAFEEAAKTHGIEYTLYMYEGTNHAFHNDTSPARYDEEAARLAWTRTIEFLRTHLA